MNAFVRDLLNRQIKPTAETAAHAESVARVTAPIRMACVLDGTDDALFQAPIMEVPVTNRFISFLEHMGHNFKRGLEVALPIAATAGETAVSIFAPGLGPLFSQTVNAVITAEQSAAALGKQQGSGPQKASVVAALVGPLIKQGLIDIGKPAEDAHVQHYIDAVVTILNSIPAPVPA
jgi:hypothetical protein